MEFKREKIKSVSLEDMSDKNEKYNDRIYSNLEHYRNYCDNSNLYSHQRLDLIIISLSTGSIAVFLSQLDKIINYSCCCINIFYFISILLFILSIATNIAGQLTSAHAHALDSAWADKQMEILNKEEEVNNIEPSTSYALATVILNMCSITFLILGIVSSLTLLWYLIF